jgi:hypothetical protein
MIQKRVNDPYFETENIFSIMHIKTEKCCLQRVPFKKLESCKFSQIVFVEPNGSNQLQEKGSMPYGCSTF